MYALTTGTPIEARLDPARIDLIRRRAADWVATGKAQCLVILLARRGVVCLHEAWGRLRPGADAPPARPDSIFWMASNTKPLTATAIMMLAEDGLLSINRRVRDYIPELCGEHTEHLTLFHLLTHTSGWQADESEAFIAARRHEHANPRYEQQSLRAGYSMPLPVMPGTTMSYCDYNYALLGEVVQRVGGMRLPEFLRARVFEPLGMVDSFMRRRVDLLDRVARLDPAHPHQEGVVIDDTFTSYMDDTYDGGFGLKSTALDYARFVQMLMNGGVYEGRRLLSRHAVAQMTRNQIPGIGTDFFGVRYPEASWGLGIRVLSDVRWTGYDGSVTAPGVFMHGGAGGTEWWADPANDLLGVYNSICLDFDHRFREPRVNFDLLQDMATAALVD